MPLPSSPAWGKHTDMLRPIDQPCTLNRPAGPRRWARIAERLEEYTQNRHG